MQKKEMYLLAEAIDRIKLLDIYMFFLIQIL